MKLSRSSLGEVESRSSIFLNSSISSPQITSTVIRPRRLSPARSCSGEGAEWNLKRGAEEERRREIKFFLTPSR